MVVASQEVSVRAMPLKQPLSHLNIELSSQAPAPRSTSHQERGLISLGHYNKQRQSRNKSLMALLPPYLYYPTLFLPLTFFTSSSSFIRYLSYSSFLCLTLCFPLIGGEGIFAPCFFLCFSFELDITVIKLFFKII